MFDLLFNRIERPLIWISSISSIVSVILLAFRDSTATIIALCVLCFSILVLLIALLRAINQYLKTSNDTPVKRIATFIEYKTLDAYRIEFQTYRIVQVKTAFLQDYEIAYNWTGTSEPRVSSDLQKLKSLTTGYTSEKSYKRMILSLPVPKFYNDTAVFHHRITADDSNHQSDTKVELRVDMPIELIRVNISLGYKPDGYAVAARVERSPIKHETPASYKSIDTIEFDRSLKEYTYTLHHPEPGYFYRISWDR